MLDVTIDEMHRDDLDEVIRLDHLAFRPYNLPPRTRRNIEHAYCVNPPGCFTAKHRGTPVGFIFSRTWGSIGWLGTFGVEEAFRGTGTGKRLLNAALENLSGNESCTVIGLETMAESAYNIGLYLKAGFRIVTPTLIVEKAIAGEQRRLPEITPSPAGDWMTEITSGVIEGFDIRNEVDADTVTIPIDEDGIRKGFALVQARPVRERCSGDSAYVKALILQERSEDLLSRAIDRVEAFCMQNGFRNVTIPVNLANASVDAWLLRKDYQVSRLAVRMVFGDAEYAVKTGVDLTRWIM